METIGIGALQDLGFLWTAHISQRQDVWLISQGPFKGPNNQVLGCRIVVM